MAKGALVHLRLLLLLALLAAVRTSASSAVVNATVDPTQTGAGIRNPGLPGFGEHFVAWRPDKVAGRACAPGSATPCGLFVHLPGSSAVPNYYKQIVVAAADLGFHAVGLAYDNPDSVGSLCGGAGMSQQDCQVAARTEAILGTDNSTAISVDAPNSIAYRLLRVLTSMHGRYPALGWDAYLVDAAAANSTAPERAADAVRWDRVRIGGHSQGAGTSQVAARLFGVRRVLLFSGGVMVNTTRYPQLERTPAERYFTFVHYQDPTVPETFVAGVEATVIGTAAISAVVDADMAAPGTALRLRTNVTSASPHGVTVADFYTPVNPSTGEPVFLPVWQAMLGTPDSYGPAGASTSTGADSSSSASAASTLVGVLSEHI